ncbi:hypothetical protein [Streptomyces longwoodensis]
MHLTPVAELGLAVLDDLHRTNIHGISVVAGGPPVGCAPALRS